MTDADRCEWAPRKYVRTEVDVNRVARCTKQIMKAVVKRGGRISARELKRLTNGHRCGASWEQAFKSLVADRCLSTYPDTANPTRTWVVIG